MLALGLVDPAWAGSTLGTGLGSWWYVGPIEWMPSEDAEANFEAAVASAQGREPAGIEENADVAAFLVADVPSESVYFVEFDLSEMSIIRDALGEYELEHVGQQEEIPDVEPSGAPVYPDPIAGPGELKGRAHPQAVAPARASRSTRTRRSPIAQWG